jgi:hypothetical protein
MSPALPSCKGWHCRVPSAVLPACYGRHCRGAPSGGTAGVPPAELPAWQGRHCRPLAENHLAETHLGSVCILHAIELQSGVIQRLQLDDNGGHMHGEILDRLPALER